MQTNFKDIDFPDNTLSPSDKTETANGWISTGRTRICCLGIKSRWSCRRSAAGTTRGKNQLFRPRITIFLFLPHAHHNHNARHRSSPHELLFPRCRVLPFHLLLAYLVDHLSIHVSFAIAAAVSVFLVVSYLRLVVGIRFEWRGGAGAVYLPGDVLVRIFPEGIHRAGDHDRVGFDIVCGHADHRSHTLGGKVYGQAGFRASI